VSIITTLVQAGTNLSLLTLVRGIVGLAFLGASLLFFKPLLIGVFRALMLLIHPRLSKEQKAARRNMRDAKLIQRMIAESNGPGLAAELQAIGARH